MEEINNGNQETSNHQKEGCKEKGSYQEESGYKEKSSHQEESGDKEESRYEKESSDQKESCDKEAGSYQKESRQEEKSGYKEKGSYQEKESGHKEKGGYQEKESCHKETRSYKEESCCKEKIINTEPAYLHVRELQKACIAGLFYYFLYKKVAFIQQSQLSKKQFIGRITFLLPVFITQTVKMRFKHFSVRFWNLNTGQDPAICSTMIPIMEHADIPA